MTGVETVRAPATGRIELEIGGMTCAACATRIEKKLNKLDGATAIVNYATERAVVTGLPADRATDVVQAVQQAGYTADVIPTDPAEADRFESSRPDRVGMLRRRLAVAAILTLPLGNLTIALALVPGLRFPYWEWLCVLIAIPVVFWCAWPFHRATLRNLRHRSFSMDTLVSLGVLSAFGWSVVSLITGAPDDRGYWLGYGITPAGADSIYLEVAAAVTTFLLTGRYFEARARRSAADVLGALNRLAANRVRLVRDGEERVVDVAELRVGDSFAVRPGETIAADGTVTDGSSSIEVSMMTGEPLPVEAEPGAGVLGGTINLTGRLLIKATQVGEQTQLAQMAVLAEQAQARKARVQRLVDRVVAVFVPAVLIIAVLTLAGWLIGGAGVREAASAAISVLIIACPCALGLATPTALMVGVGRAGQLGIVIKGPDALEASGEIDTVVLDKTGTLTEGSVAVRSVQVVGELAEPEVIRLAAAVERHSEHPVGAAIAALAEPESPAPDVIDFAAEPGLGARGSVAGRQVVIGNTKLLDRHGIAVPDPAAAALAEAEAEGQTGVLVAVDGTVVAVLGLADTIRDSAAGAVAELRRLGLSTVLLTGDNERAANAVGRAIGVDAVIADVLPTQKAAAIESLQAGGAKVAMVGDGINDATALATADLGLAVINGTDIALRSADLILVRRHLGVIPDAIELSRKTLRTIRGNLIWAFGYNIAAIPLAAAGWLNPLIAGVAMSLSSVFVVTNSLRLRSFRA
ncbi:heavy metal translocating P-type ATPase [Microlunatus speluncae]|uniref:heavy metal translocating P-type ATPase n=1 Tax=Microlunatus speluncae TaxID=2594267 RepID=UPI00126643C7|nr:heavy metal translocating P-type ATPase [Microlunatus speluncae]